MTIQKETWRSPKVEIKQADTKGHGMFAKAPISVGEAVIIFGGEYVAKDEAEKAKKQGKLVMQWDADLYSVEERGDDPSYFINHSCDPNVWMADAFSLVARRDITPGEEVTADYALWEADEDYVSKWTCQCGAPNCRGHVTGKDWRKSALQKAYAGHFSPLINERIVASK